MPTCPDCSVEMVMGPDTFHALMVSDPQRGLLRQWYPVSLYECRQCGFLKLYSAERREPEAWETAPGRLHQ